MSAILLQNVGWTTWCETNKLRNLKRKMWGTWCIIFPLSEKVGGRVPHLIVPMAAATCKQSGPKQGEGKDQASDTKN